MAEKKEKKEMNFEDSLVSLEAIVKKLETGEVPLKLKTAEEAITKLVKDNGDVVDFQVDEA